MSPAISGAHPGAQKGDFMFEKDIKNKLPG